MLAPKLLRVLIPSGQTLMADSNNALSEFQSLHRCSVHTPQKAAQLRSAIKTTVCRMRSSRLLRPSTREVFFALSVPCLSAGKNALPLLQAGALVTEDEVEEKEEAGGPWGDFRESCCFPLSGDEKKVSDSLVVSPHDAAAPFSFVSFLRCFASGFNFEDLSLLALFGGSRPDAGVVKSRLPLLPRRRSMLPARTQAPTLGRYSSCAEYRKTRGCKWSGCSAHGTLDTKPEC